MKVNLNDSFPFNVRSLMYLIRPLKESNSGLPGLLAEKTLDIQ